MELPVSFDPYRAASAAKRYRGQISAGSFKRLESSVLSIVEEGIEIDLQFGSRQGARATLHGTVKAEVEMECQRCLGPMRVPVKGEMNLAFVRFQSELDGLPEELEPIMLEEADIDLMALIEDELILALPLVPMHQENCQPWQDEEVATEEAEAEPEERENPFAVLAQLKKDS